MGCSSTVILYFFVDYLLFPPLSISDLFFPFFSVTLSSRHFVIYTRIWLHLDRFFGIVHLMECASHSKYKEMKHSRGRDILQRRCRVRLLFCTVIECPTWILFCNWVQFIPHCPCWCRCHAHFCCTAVKLFFLPTLSSLFSESYQQRCSNPYFASSELVTRHGSGCKDFKGTGCRAILLW